MDDSLLRNVRSEIQENVHFTPKETDIYRIHQSGDLANLDGLDDDALSKLPSLLKLRDALYSPAFRKYVASITNAGKLSGRKTDMAINVYTPGCHLLCHDDVIGSRRVSYILYLTDPDIPWQEEWGGALRLYPTKSFTDDRGEVTKAPSPDFSKSIPPAWNQLSFFAVQPGESFHDVEEVYYASSKEQLEKDGGRIRMAISGWYHIPQIGEDGYIRGAEQKLAEKSSLMQLQGKADRYDLPKEPTIPVENLLTDGEEILLDAVEIDFLLKYMSPTYLTPDTMEQVVGHFTEEGCITLASLLSVKFAARLYEYVEEQEALTLPLSSEEIGKGLWRVARPPHKHRFLYLAPFSLVNKYSPPRPKQLSPIQELLEVFLPSREFRKWLSLATQCAIVSHNILARRFRRGLDYALATVHEGSPRLELSLGITPTRGWREDDNDAEEDDVSRKDDDVGHEDDAGQDDDAEQDDDAGHEDSRGQADKDGNDKNDSVSYAGRDDDCHCKDLCEQVNNDGNDDDTSKEEPSNHPPSSPKVNGNAAESRRHNGASSKEDPVTNPSSPTPNETTKNSEPAPEVQSPPLPDDLGGQEVYMPPPRLDEDSGDAAIYKSSPSTDENILFAIPPSFNELSIVLRDAGVLKFVKYVSHAARGDRWDLWGWFGVRDDDEGTESTEVGGDRGRGGREEVVHVSLEDSEEEVFKGFPQSEDSDSD